LKLNYVFEFIFVHFFRFAYFSDIDEMLGSVIPASLF
jgi:hypothetical protein